MGPASRLWDNGHFQTISRGPLFTHRRALWFVLQLSRIEALHDSEKAMTAGGETLDPCPRTWSPLTIHCCPCPRPLPRAPHYCFSPPQPTACLPLFCSKSSKETEDLAVNRELAQRAGLSPGLHRPSMVVHTDNLSSHSEAGGGRI